MHSIPSIATRRGGRSTPGPWKQRNLARHYTSISSHRARTVVVRCIWTSLTYVHTYVALLERPNRGPTCQLDYPRLASSAADACPSHSLSHATNTTQHNQRAAGCGRRKRGRRRPGAGAGASGGDPAFFGGVEWSGGAVAVEGSRGFWLCSVG
jgi:hypothetical protein